MKKFLALGALALTLTLAQTQQASAWINSKFGIGLSWDWQSGNNSFLWGGFRGGDPGGPMPSGRRHHGPAYGHGHGGMMPFTPAPTEATSAPVFMPPSPTPTHAYYPPGYSYENVGYSYYTMPVYYYPASYPSFYYGR